MTGARLVLLRHGEAQADGRCAGQRFDPPLSPRGRSQARSALARLPEPIDALATSPATRARETAAVWPLAGRVEAELAERDFGSWEGRPWQELWPTVPPPVLGDPAAYAAYTPPQGESVDAVTERAWAAAQRLTAEAGTTVLAVTHAGPLRLVVARALGLDPAGAFALAASHGRAAVLVRHGNSWILERLGA